MGRAKEEYSDRFNELRRRARETLGSWMGGEDVALALAWLQAEFFGELIDALRDQNL